MKHLQAKIYLLATRASHFNICKGPGKQVGATAIEYALIAALVSIAMIAFLPAVGEAIKGTFEDILNALTGSSGSGGGGEGG